MSAWLDIIGMGEAGELAPQMRALIDRAEVVIGVRRRLAGLDLHAQNIIEWDGALDQMVSRIMAARRTPTVLLASGDPNWFGIGATLSRHLPHEEFALHPAPSSFQLAAARLHWPLQNVTTLSLHGRPVATLQPHILPAHRILALTSDASTLAEVAEMLRERGYGSSRLTVLENLGATSERRTALSVADASSAEIGDFYVLAIDCVAGSGAALLPTVPGLPDEVFLNDGQLTKREVRAITLARLAPYPGALLWDVGAGCGSVAIEWMRAARDARAICFESEGERLQMIALNRVALGVPALEIVPGEAPATLDGRNAPDAIFLGGGVADETLFDACWTALRPGGRLVANAVTLEGEMALYERHRRLGGALTRLEIANLEPIGGYRAMRPRMPVTQWMAIKEEHQ